MRCGMGRLVACASDAASYVTGATWTLTRRLFRLTGHRLQGSAA